MKIKTNLTTMIIENDFITALGCKLVNDLVFVKRIPFLYDGVDKFTDKASAELNRLMRQTNEGVEYTRDDLAVTLKILQNGWASSLYDIILDGGKNNPEAQVYLLTVMGVAAVFAANYADLGIQTDFRILLLQGLHQSDRSIISRSQAAGLEVIAQIMEGESYVSK